MTASTPPRPSPRPPREAPQLHRSHFLARAPGRVRQLALIAASWSVLLVLLDVLFTRAAPGGGAPASLGHILLVRGGLMAIPLVCLLLPRFLKGEALVTTALLVALVYDVANDWAFFTLGLGNTRYQLVSLMCCLTTTPNILPLERRSRLAFFAALTGCHVAGVLVLGGGGLPLRAAEAVAAVLGAAVYANILEGIAQGQRSQFRLRMEAQASLAALEASRDGVLEAGQTLTDSAGALTSTTHALSRQAAHLREEAERISGTSARLAGSARSLSEAGRASAGRAEGAARATGDVDALVGGMESGMGELERAVQEATLAVRALQERGAKVGGIVATIKELAAETNMLALNAGIEAMRAGEHGRGFGVVAREVRRLAEAAGRSSEQAREGMAALEGQVRQVLGVVERIRETSARTAPVFASARGALSGIRASVLEAHDSLARAAQEADVQAGGTAAISEATARLLALVEEHAATSVDVAATSSQLGDLAEELRRLLPREAGGAAPSAAAAPPPARG
jgi:methyl-accepting chemotaxis protein